MELLVSLLLIYLVISLFIRLSKINKKISFYLNLIIMTITIGTIYEKIPSGGDFDVNRIGFNNVLSEPIPEKEVLFHFLKLSIRLITDNFYIAFFIFILIINYLILKMIYEYSNNIEASLIVYVIIGGYVMATNITRQFIAISIYFYSIKYLLKNKYLKYILLNIIALGFHNTSIIASLITLIIKRYNQRLFKYYNLYFIFINLIIFIEPIIRDIGINIFYDSYSDGSFFYGSSILHYIVQLALVIFYMINKDNIKSDTNKFFVNLAMISLGFNLLAVKMVMYSRFAAYFNIFNPIVLVNIIENNKSLKEKRIFIYLVFILLITYYLLLTRKSFIFESHVVDFFN